MTTAQASAVALAERTRSRARTVQAMGLLCVAAAAQRWIPMTRWSWVIGRHGRVPPAWDGQTIVELPNRAATPTERRVARSLRRASRLLPWEPTCLAQATAGQIMLRERGEPGTVVIGLRRPDDARDGQPWDAHAWLLGRDGALTGGPAARGFTATTVFAPSRRR